MNKINNIDEIRFQCQGSSNCCISRGEYGYVYLSKKDIVKLSKHMKLSIINFIKLYCEKTDDYIHLKEIKENGNCQFLKNKKCSVYKARPVQCRTWPFWNENMNFKKWNTKITEFCPGIGKGPIFKKSKIQKIINADLENERKILYAIK